jgi:hypothetical protein
MHYGERDLETITARPLREEAQALFEEGFCRSLRCVPVRAPGRDQHDPKERGARRGRPQTVARRMRLRSCRRRP